MAENKIIGMLSLGAPIRKGPQGPQGPIGPTGPVGPRGERGEIGPAGPQGERGIEGMPGPQGERGLQGPKGDRGEQGPRGEQGLRGEQGPRGETGPQGLTGPQGAKGAQGLQGIQGKQGIKGAKGDTGATGPKGDKGEPGENGKDGVLIEDSKVSNVNTWSSKQIIDHLLQDNEWKAYDNKQELTDAANGYIRGLEIEGQTLKNILTLEDYKKLSFFKKHNWKVENDCMIIFNNKKDEEWDATLEDNTPHTKFKDKTTYTLIFFVYENTIGSINILRNNFDGRGNHERYGAISGTGIFKFKLISDFKDTIKGVWRIARDVVGENTLKFRYMILEGDYTQKDVPDFIEGVQGVGLKTEKGYKIGVKTHGKNLLNINKIEIGGLNSSGVVNRLDIQYRATDFIKVEAGKQYSKNFTEMICLYNENKSFIKRIPNQNPLLIEAGTSFIRCTINKDDLKKGVQIEEGTHATKYEPYKESTSEIILQDQLQGIGDIKDKLYFDEGYKVEKKIGEVKLLEEDVESHFILDDGKSNILYSTQKYINYKTYGKVESNILRALTTEEAKELNNFKANTIGVRSYLVFGFEEGLTRQQRQEKIKEYIRNGLELFIELATPTTTDTQIKTELLPQTYKNKTYISVDSGVKPTLKGQYPQDIKIHTAEEIKQLAREAMIEQAQELGVLPQFGTLEETEWAEDEIETLEEFQDDPTTLEEA